MSLGNLVNDTVDLTLVDIGLSLLCDFYEIVVSGVSGDHKVDELKSNILRDEAAILR